MNIAIVGSGYVGLVTGACFAEIGVNVTCVDVDWNKIEKLKQGEIPIYEPGLKELVQKNQKAGRLDFTTSLESVLDKVQVIFSAVGTPPDEDGSADLKYVLQVARTIGRYMTDYKLVVTKSTVPVGTAQKVRHAIQEELDERGLDIAFDVASNPEFLREGRAVGDFNNPDRIVLGVFSEEAGTRLRTLYKVFARSNKPIVVTTPETAEMIKYASNAFLATKITFINEIANLCEQVGANALEVAAAMGKDGRISPKFLHPGSCFPKDTKALADTGVKYNAPLTVVESVIAANQRQKQLAARKVTSRFPQGGTIAVLGLSFKPETDDIRESPAVEMVQVMLEAGGFTLRLYDPKAMDNAKAVLGADRPGLVWCASTAEAVQGADAAVIATEWSEFSTLDFDRLKAEMHQPILFDLRNVYHKEDVTAQGFEYYGTGV